MLYVTNGKDFWRGIRDGGRLHRRSQMYAFLAKHKDGKGVKTAELRHVYETCLKTAKELSRTKGYRNDL